MSEGAGEVSRLLHAWAGGDLRARDELAPLVYQELRKRAAGYLRHERVDHTLQATALVHEAFLRLAGQDRVAWQNRGHFYAVAAQMMRRILVDHARERQAQKRPNPAARVELDGQIPASETSVDVLMLDVALTDLSAYDPRQGQIVELRYFGGLSEQQVAETLGVSRATVTREWKRARAWLYHRMTPPRRAPTEGVS
jgi:RNA polymerase sigma factor (TIGR02999 family)